MGTPTPSLRPTAPSSSLTSSAALTAGAPTVRRCVTGTGLTFATLPPARRTMRVSGARRVVAGENALTVLERLGALLGASRGSPAVLLAEDARGGATAGLAGDWVGDRGYPPVPGRAGDLATALAEMFLGPGTGSRPRGSRPPWRPSRALRVMPVTRGVRPSPRSPRGPSRETPAPGQRATS